MSTSHIVIYNRSSLIMFNKTQKYSHYKAHPHSPLSTTSLTFIPRNCYSPPTSIFRSETFDTSYILAPLNTHLHLKTNIKIALPLAQCFTQIQNSTQALRSPQNTHTRDQKSKRHFAWHDLNGQHRLPYRCVAFDISLPCRNLQSLAR
jgi:hypothetical protein